MSEVQGWNLEFVEKAIRLWEKHWMQMSDVGSGGRAQIPNVARENSSAYKRPSAFRKPD